MYLRNDGRHRGRLIRAGFAAIWVLLAAIIAMCLRKDLFGAKIGDLFNLSMDVLGCLACALLYYGGSVINDRRRDAVKAFSTLILVNAATLFLDAAVWFVDDDPAHYAVNLALSTLFYAVVDISVFLFWRYARAVLRPKAKRCGREYNVQYVALALALLMCLSNLVSPVIFSVSEAGVFGKAWGYPLGFCYILLTLIMIAVEVIRSDIRTGQKAVAVVFTAIPIAAFILTWSIPRLTIAYSAVVIGMLITNCVLFTGRIRLKELVVRLFALLLLFAMLIYSPAIYAVSLRDAIQEGYNSASSAMTLLSKILDKVGLDRLSDPENTELYQDTRKQMRLICGAFGLQNMYVEHIDPDAPSRTYVIAVANTDADDARLRETLGWPGASIWKETSSITKPELRALAGEYTRMYSEQNNTYGHNLDWFYPYKDAEGRVCALMGVDIEVARQQAKTIRYAVREIIPVLTLFFITLLVLLRMLDWLFLGPIYAIAHHIQGFIMEGRRRDGALAVDGGYEIWLLSKSFDFMVSELDEYEALRAKEIQEKQRIATELDMAASIQAHYLPNRFPAFPDRGEFDLCACMDPAREVGGDFYDFFLIDGDHLAMVVADVSGKGVPAALFMMISKTMLKSAAQSGFSPAGVLEKVNAQLAADNDDNMFVTVWLGILEIPTGRLTYADAGHERLLRYSGGQWQFVQKETGFPLALFEDSEPVDPDHPENYVDQTLTLSPGDAIFQYTDGIPEAVNGRNEMFGEEQLLQAISEAPPEDAQAILAHLRGRIDAFTGDAPQFDDITMLCLRYRGEPGRMQIGYKADEKGDG